MNVYWLEQTKEDLPKNNDWLSASELAVLQGLNVPKRRADWRLGRWTAKNALAVYLNLPHSPATLQRIEIRPAPSGAPEAFCEDDPAPVTISLSHSNDNAMCAVAPGKVKLGCDLELAEPRSDAFIADYFTREEQALNASQPSAKQPELLALLWSAKESALKALSAGLRLDTRSVEVARLDLSRCVDTWSPLQVHYGEEQIFHGWWRLANGMARTLIAVPEPASPVPLKLAAASNATPSDGGSGLPQSAKVFRQIREASSEEFEGGSSRSALAGSEW
jgi:4'-phosphopantetheinyl transferase